MSQGVHRRVTAIQADLSALFFRLCTHSSTKAPSQISRYHQSGQCEATMPCVRVILLLTVARAVQRDRKQYLRECINLRRSAKYSSNFTPEWIKTPPFIFFQVTGKTLRLKFNHCVWDICSHALIHFKQLDKTPLYHYCNCLIFQTNVLQTSWVCRLTQSVG